MEKTEVNCLEKNPCVEKHYASMSKEQKLAEAISSLESARKIVRGLENEVFQLRCALLNKGFD